jgi:hypothetical protein
VTLSSNKQSKQSDLHSRTRYYLVTTLYQDLVDHGVKYVNSQNAVKMSKGLLLNDAPRRTQRHQIEPQKRLHPHLRIPDQNYSVPTPILHSQMAVSNPPSLDLIYPSGLKAWCCGNSLEGCAKPFGSGSLN